MLSVYKSILCGTLGKGALHRSHSFAYNCTYVYARRISNNYLFKHVFVPVDLIKRSISINKKQRINRRRNFTYYLTSAGIFFFGIAMISVPAYRMFCERSTFVGLTKEESIFDFSVADDLEYVASMKKVDDRLIRVRFNADLDSSMKWQFKPMQKEIYVHPGETALVFYSAYNPTNEAVIGISTYNVTPFAAAYYFNKIQCFCFEDQLLAPGEQVELPILFYIDPDFVNDPSLEYVTDLLLSYTFYESKTGLVLPDPFDPNNQPKSVPKTEKSAGLPSADLPQLKPSVPASDKSDHQN